MITYVLTISEKFPKTHNRSGAPTNFVNQIFGGVKKHTIRGNYDLWKKRFEKINQGKAILSLRYWEGKPYASKQIEIIYLHNTMGIGLQRLDFVPMIMTTKECIKKANGSIYIPMIMTTKEIIRTSDGSIGIPTNSNLEALAQNDGLSLDDFKEWFKKYDLSKPMAIIHFTQFRYN